MLTQIQTQLNNKLSLYIHWPFCISKCPYCDFNSHVQENIDYQVWEQTYLREIEHFKHLFENCTIKSIFFGGGTPSLMKPSTVDAIICKISDYTTVDKNIEITLEANPTSVEASKFIDFKAAGINRISIGVQSFNENELKFLGRQHNAEEAITAIKLAEKYFHNYSFDLIYALPGQTLKDVDYTVNKALEFAAGHISLYQLTIEKGTKFYSMYKKKDFSLPSHELSGKMYDLVNDKLMHNGFDRYEISNYAKPSYECTHNLCYWNYEEYLGIGPGAHSRLSPGSLGIEHRNVNKVYAMHTIYNPQNWLNQTQQLGHGIKEKIPISNNELLDEIIMMGLRTKYGVSRHKILDYFKVDVTELINKEKLLSFEKQGLLTIDDDYIKLTDNGMNIHSYILRNLL